MQISENIYRINGNNLFETIKTTQNDYDCAEKIKVILEDIKKQINAPPDSSSKKLFFQFYLDKPYLILDPIALAAPRAYWLTIKILVIHSSPSNYGPLDIFGNALIHYACYLGLQDKVEEILREGVDINIRNDYGQTPLWKAAKGNNKKLVSFLIEQPHCDLEAKSHKGDSALSLVASQENWDLARLIVEKLPLNNEVDKNGYALIHYACFLGMFEKVKKLLKYSPDYNLEGCNGNPLDQAKLGLKLQPVVGEHQQIISYLEENHPKPFLNEKKNHPTPNLIKREGFKFLES